MNKISFQLHFELYKISPFHSKKYCSRKYFWNVFRFVLRRNIFYYSFFISNKLRSIRSKMFVWVVFTVKESQHCNLTGWHDVSTFWVQFHSFKYNRPLFESKALDTEYSVYWKSKVDLLVCDFSIHDLFVILNWNHCQASQPLLYISTTLDAFKMIHKNRKQQINFLFLLGLIPCM